MYVSNNTLLVAHVFRNFQNIYLEIYEFHARFLTAPRLEQSKIKSTNWYWNAINGRKMSGRICHPIH